MANYYLDPVNGNDGNTGTSWGQAWKTLAGALAKVALASGDILILASGTYDGGSSAVLIPTTMNGKSVTIQADTAGGPLLTGSARGVEVNSGVTTGLVHLVGCRITTTGVTTTAYLVRQYFDTDFSLSFTDCDFMLPAGATVPYAVYSTTTVAAPAPVRTLTCTACRLSTLGTWNGYFVLPNKLAALTIDGFAVSGDVRRLVAGTNYTKVITLKRVSGTFREGLFVGGGAGVTTCDRVEISACSNLVLGADQGAVAGSLFNWNYNSPFTPDVLIHDNVASGYNDCIYIANLSGTPSGRVSILRNVLTWDAAGGGSHHGIGPFDNTLGGVVAHNSVRFAPKTGTYALVLKGNYVHAVGNVFEAQFAITVTRGNGLCVFGNTARSNLASGHALKLARHQLIGDYWPEYGTFANNILDAGPGHWALNIEYEAGKAPPAGFFKNRFNANLLCAGTSGRANAYGTACANLAALQAAWAALVTSQGAMAGNDVDSLEGDPQYLNLAAGDLRLSRASPARGDGTLGQPGMGAYPVRDSGVFGYWW